jgi:MFS family permease
MSRPKIYSGWTQLVLAALAMVGTLPGRTQGLGLVTEPLIADLGLDRVTYANLNLWGTLIGAVLCIPVGRWLDRFGSRVVLTVVVSALGATVIVMSLASGVPALAVTVTLTRGLGQSALSVVSLALVGKWFARRLDHAMAIFSVLVAVGFIAAFPSVGEAVQAFGWRPTWLAVGLVELLLLAPLAAFLVRNQPEDQGLALDGTPATEDHGAPDFTLWEALRTPAFWIFALSSAIFGLVYSGIALFNESILAERGFDAGTYYRVLVISTSVGLAANFGAGFLASRWSLQKVMGIGMAVLAIALCALPLVTTQTHVVLYGVAMGAAGGVVTVVSSRCGVVPSVARNSDGSRARRR